MPLARTGRPISRRKKRVIPRPMVQPSVEDLSPPNTGYNPSSRAQLSSAVAVPTEGDIGGPRVTARRVCADPVHVVVRELTPADGRAAVVSLSLISRCLPGTQSCLLRVAAPRA